MGNNIDGCFVGWPAGETLGAAADYEDPRFQHEHFHRPAHVRCDITALPGDCFIQAVFKATRQLPKVYVQNIAYFGH